MTSFVVKNNAESLVADNPLAQAAVTLNVTASEGANFPSTCPFLITLWDESVYPDPSDDSGMEIVKCTARTTDALTIVRAQEGTADVAHALGDRVGMLITAGIIDELIAEIVEDTTPQLGGDLDPNTHFIGMAKGGDIASASPLVVDTDGDYFDVTGTTGFAAMTVAANRHFFLQFDGILTMTHHATNLDLPGEANITTAAGDVGEFFSTGANTVQCVSYTKASGEAVVGGGATLITKSIADIATDINGASTNSIPASYFNTLFAIADSALIFREAGLSIANINAIIIHANITDDNAQQILSEITKANRDLTSAANIYEILDDWADNKLTGRDGADTTSTGFTNLFAQKELFRPEWTTLTGTPAVASGKLELDTAEHVKISSTFGVGTWEVDATVPVTTGQPLLKLYAAPAGAYDIIRWITDDGANEQVSVYDMVDSAFVFLSAVGDSPWDTNPHTLKTTRDGSGVFEGFYDGVSKDTGTDTTTTSFDELHIEATAQACKFDNLKVY